MIATKYSGVFYRDAKNGTRTFYIRYRHNGKSIRQVVGTKDQGITAKYAERMRNETLAKLHLGDNAPIQRRSTAVSLHEITTQYFAQLEAKSIQKLISVYRTHLISLADIPINDIDKTIIEKLKKDKSKEVSHKTGRVLSLKTVNNILSLLSAILHYAKEQEVIKGVPTIKKHKEDNARERFLSTREIEILFAAIYDSDIRTKERVTLFTKLSLMTGGRLGSILSIQGKHIDRANKTITLHNHKTGKDYTAFLPSSLLALIPNIEPQEYLIDVSDAKQIQRPLQGILDTLFNKGLDAEDRKQRVVIHTLRHTYASHLAINGTPIHTIMKLMNHSDIKMTLRYAKLMPDSGRDMVESLYQ